jgi:3-hydroxybutyryl-CoA dehydrogenase
VIDQIEHVPVVGAGYMGGGIARVFATAGPDVAIVDTAYAKLGQLLRGLGPAPL